MLRPNEHFAQFGGVHFINNVPPEEINRFVRELPEAKKDSLFEVILSESKGSRFCNKLK